MVCLALIWVCRPGPAGHESSEITPERTEDGGPPGYDKPGEAMAFYLEQRTGDSPETIKIKGYTADTGSSETLTINQATTIEAISGAIRVGGAP